MRSAADRGTAVASLRAWLGVPLDEVSRREKLASAVGGALGILIVIAVSEQALGLDGAPMLIGSMGASAVLLFAVPHGALSQPWPVLAGHGVSALIGVTCARAIPNRPVAAACAVGLAIGAMHQFKFVHPPGGATALTAVIAGPAVWDLGYSFVLRPVLLNAVTMLVVAVAFNALFPWRRYPVALARYLARNEPAAVAVDGGAAAATGAVAAQVVVPSHERLLEALRSMDSFIDVTEDDLARLHRFLSEPPP